MNAGQVIGLIFAILLLLPGGCFLAFGIGFTIDKDSYPLGLLLMGISGIVLAMAGLLFWAAFHRRNAGRPPL